MSDHEPNLPALRREWLAARIMAALGVLLLIAVVTLLIIPLVSGDGAAPPAAPSVAAAPVDTPEARRDEDIALCDAAVATAQKSGLLPVFAVRDGDRSTPGDAQGRYVCRAKTDAARYSIAFDLACTHLGDAGCILLYRIEQDGGGVLYQRR